MFLKINPLLIKISLVNIQLLQKLTEFMIDNAETQM